MIEFHGHDVKDMGPLSPAEAIIHLSKQPGIEQILCCWHASSDGMESLQMLTAGANLGELMTMYGGIVASLCLSGIERERQTDGTSGIDFASWFYSRILDTTLTATEAAIKAAGCDGERVRRRVLVDALHRLLAPTPPSSPDVPGDEGEEDSQG